MAFDPFNDVLATLLKYCTDFVADNALQNFDTFDWDAHASIGHLPGKNLIGVAEYSMVEDAGLYTYTMMIAVSTTAEDQGNKILKTVIGKLTQALKSNQMMTVVRSNSGATVGKLTVQPPVEVMPVALTEGRPLQAVALRVASTFLVPP